MKAKFKTARKSNDMKGADDYSGSGKPNVVKEAEEKKHGGKVVDKPEGKKAKMRMDKKPRRASGGRVGSDKSPFSSAARPGITGEA